MIENYEFRIFARYSDLLGEFIHNSFYARYGMIKVHGIVGDPQFQKLAKIDRHLRADGLSGIFAGWKIKRTYSRDEIKGGKLFLLRIPITQVSAEDYGTEYEESIDCLQKSYDLTLEDRTGARTGILEHDVPCGLCAKQSSLVRLPANKFQKRDIYRLPGGEVIISRRLRDLIYGHHFSGATIYPVEKTGQRGLSFTTIDSDSNPDEISLLASQQRMLPNQLTFWKWLYKTSSRDVVESLVARRSASGRNGAMHHDIFQLIVESNPLEVSSDTRFGDDPFDMNSGGHFRCKSGEIAGNMLLSPLKVIPSSWSGADLCRTRIHVSGRQGYYRPYQLLVVSKRLFDEIQHDRIKGAEFELADMV